MSLIITSAGDASALLDLAVESGIDLSEISKAVGDRIDERITAALKADVDLAKLTKPKPRRFLLAYAYEGKRYIVSGLDIPNEGGEGKPLVMVNDQFAPFCSHYSSMEDLGRVLEKRHKLSYCIVYLDK